MRKEKKVAGKAWVGGWVLVGLRVQDRRAPGGEEGVPCRRGEGGAAPRRMEKCELVFAKLEEKRFRRKSFIQKALQSLLWAVVGTFEASLCLTNIGLLPLTLIGPAWSKLTLQTLKLFCYTVECDKQRIPLTAVKTSYNSF